MYGKGILKNKKIIISSERICRTLSNRISRESQIIRKNDNTISYQIKDRTVNTDIGIPRQYFWSWIGNKQVEGNSQRPYSKLE